MTQAALQVANGAGASVRSAINSALMALATLNIGPTAPATTYGGMLWGDTGSGTLWRRKSDNSAWVRMGQLDADLSAQFAALAGSGSQTFSVATATAAAHAVRLDQMNTAVGAKVSLSGGNLTGPVNANLGTELPSAETVNLGAATGEYVYITGTTNISAFGTVQAGTEREVVFTGSLVLNQSASLLLPTSAPITTAPWDMARFRSEGGGIWRCVSYTRASGKSLAASTPLNSGVRLNTGNGNGTTNTKYRRFTNVAANTGSDITYADSATLGASFTINTAGTYSISYSESVNAPNSFGIALNDNQPTIQLASTTPANILACGTVPSSGYITNASWTGPLPAGSVITAKTDNAYANSGPAALFSISRVG